MTSMIVGYMLALGSGYHVECVACAETDYTPATVNHIPIYDQSIPPYNYQTCHECGCDIASATEANGISELHPNPLFIFEPASEDIFLDEPFNDAFSNEVDLIDQALVELRKDTFPAPPTIDEEYIDTLPCMKMRAMSSISTEACI